MYFKEEEPSGTDEAVSSLKDYYFDLCFGGCVQRCKHFVLRITALSMSYCEDIDLASE